MDTASTAHHIDARVELETARERLALDEQHAQQLEARHRANEKAMAMISASATATATTQREGAMLCHGKEAFISLPVDDARAAMERDNKRIWETVDELQRSITKQARELEEMEDAFKALVNKNVEPSAID